jgi:hypothetical protein
MKLSREPTRLERLLGRVLWQRRRSLALPNTGELISCVETRIPDRLASQLSALLNGLKEGNLRPPEFWQQWHDLSGLDDLALRPLTQLVEVYIRCARLSPVVPSPGALAVEHPTRRAASAALDGVIRHLNLRANPTEVVPVAPPRGADREISPAAPPDEYDAP